MADRSRPLTAAQSGIWYSGVLDPTGLRYVGSQYVHLHGPVDEELFARAVRAVVAGSETLRVRFAERDDSPVQFLEPLDDWEVRLLDLRGAEHPQEEALRLIEENSLRPYDLSRAPLFDHHLLRVADDAYLWAIRMHHLICDGTAAANFIRRVAATYTAWAAGTAGQPQAGPALFDSLDALVERDTAYRSSARFGEDAAWWATRLAGRDEAPQLATGGAPAGATGHVSHIRWLPADRWHRLTTAAARHEVRWPALFAAATALAVHADTGERQTVLGLSVPGRTGRAARQALGTAANVVPLHVAVDPAAPLAELVAAAWSGTLGVLRHQRYRFEDMLRDQGAVRDGRPLVGPVLNAMTTERGLSFAGTPAVVHQVTPGRGDHLALGVHDNGAAQVRIDLGVPASLCTPPAARAQLDRLVDLTLALADADPATPQGRVGVCRTARPPVPAGPGAEAEPATLTGLFAAVAAARPDAVAVVAGGDRLTYARLDARAEELARHLAARGVGPGDRVAVSLPRSAGLVVALLAVLKAGAAYVPLDPAHPAERLRATLADAAPALALVRPGATVAPVPGGDDVPVLTLDPRRGTLTGPEAEGAPGVAPRRPAPGSPAYLIHTSGSTGTPKGVVVTHHNVTRLLSAAARHFTFGADDVWTLFHSYAFDFSVWELWGALLHGGRLVIVPEDVARSPHDFLELLAEERVTVLNQTPSAFGQLAEAEAERPAVGDRLALRYVVFGGEPLEPWRLATWLARHPGPAPRLVNMYGITETTVHVTHHLVDPAAAASGPAGGVIGSPLPDLRIRLLDAALRPVPDGVPGEMYVSGPGVADGYWHRPGLTAGRFVPDPDGPPGSRAYRSGDLARRLPGGALEYLGRADRQVKVRGHRVEPAEVEAALVALPGVRDAAVLLTEYGPGDRRLVAHLVADPESAALAPERAAAVLPAHLLPSVWATLDALPLTTNGKLDRRALLTAGHQVSGEGRAPRNPAETALRDLFAEVLGREPDQIGVDRSFFTLGGDSLLAGRLVGRVRATLSRDLGVRGVFTWPTVAGLAVRLGETDGTADARPGPVPRPGLVPVSHAQRGLWFLHRLEETGHAYHVPLAVRLKGPLDTGALRAAARDVQQRHEILRTTFPHDGDGPRQHVLPAAEAPDPLTVVPHAGEQDAHDDAYETALREPFDLAAAPPWRVTLLCRSPHEHTLLVVLHHIAADQQSIGPLTRDLATAYESRRRGEAPAWPPLPLQYADFTLWQRARLGAPDDPGSPLSRELAHWREALREAPAETPLPADRPGRPGAEHPGDAVGFDWGARLGTRLKELAAARGATTFMALHAALACALSRWGAGTDMVVGTVTAGREDPALEPLAGYFAQALPLRLDLAGDPGFATVVDRARTAGLTAFAHTGAPFDRIVEAVGPPREPGRHPLFQVMLNHRSGARPALRLAGLRATELPQHRSVAKYPLLWDVAEEADGTLHGCLEYATDRFRRRTAEALLDAVRHFLEAALDRPEAPFTGLPCPRPGGGPAESAPPAAVPPAPTPGEEARAGEAATEELLRSLTATLLGRDSVDADANFFRLGGDSILAVQLAARAQAAGVPVGPKDVFAHQSPRALARTVQGRVRAAAPARPSQDPGPLEPTPVVEWLASLGGDAGGFAQSVVVPLPATATGASVRTALQHLVDHHDALRLRRTAVTGGRWELEVRPPGAVPAGELLRHVDLAREGADDPAAYDALIEQERRAARRHLDPDRGDVVRAVLFHGREDRLLLVIHHLAVDGVSWRVLLPDLELAHRHALRGEHAPLPPVPTPLRAWTRALRTAARSEAVRADETWWRGRLAAPHAGLGSRPLDPARDTVDRAGRLSSTWDETWIEPLLTTVPAAFRARVPEILLAALSLALRRWSGNPQGAPVRVDLEGHGRRPGLAGLADLDLSRTVGWFTTLHPVLLDPPPATGSPAEVSARAVTHVKERLREVPHDGLTHGLLRQEGRLPDARAPLAFNYLGRLDTEDPAPWHPLPGSLRGEAGPRQSLAHPLTLDVFAERGPGGPRLRAEWTWASGVLTDGQAEELAGLWHSALAELVHHHPGTGPVRSTPSDFPLVRVDQSHIETWEERYGPLADLLPAAPLQEGLLFHALYGAGTGPGTAGSGEDPYLVQLSLDLSGDVEPHRLRTALRALLRRHPHLTGCFPPDAGRPLLMVPADEPALPWRTADLTAEPEDRLATRTDEEERAERRPFDPGRPPLLRFALLRTGERRWRLVFTHHHLLLDGWSVPLVLRELLDPAATGEPAPALGEYARWLAARDQEAAAEAWRHELAGAEPTRVAGHAPAAPTTLSHRFELSGELARALTDRAAHWGVTLNTLVESAWALLLNHLTGRQDVVFGVTVAQRPPEIAGVERLPGLLLNTVPARVRLDPARTAREVAEDTHARRAELLDHHHLGLTAVEEASGTTGLFDTSVVFENYPLDEAAFTRLPDGVEVTGTGIHDGTHYPLSLVVLPRSGRIECRLYSRPGALDHYGTPPDLAALCTAAFHALLADDPLARLQLLAAPARKAVLAAGRGPASPVRENTSHLAQVFEARAAAHPDRPALSDATRTLTYGALEARANQLAHHLADQVHVGTPVAVALDRSIEVAVCYLALAKLGALCVPLHSGLPPARQRALRERTGAALLLDRLPDEETLAACPDVPPGRDVPADLAACVVFTSGSTGEPKGVRLTHRSVLSRALDPRWQGEDHRCVLLHSPHAWDAVVYELWAPLLTGRRVRVAPPGELDGAALRRAVEDGGVTAAFLTSGLLDVLAEQDPGALAGLRVLATGGDVVSPRSVERLRARHPELTVVHLYGPVENTTFSLGHALPPGRPVPAPLPLGTPVPGCRVTVLDAALRPVPPGVPGEIHLSGDGLAEGYHGSPAATCERFVADPYGPPGARAYRTGDLARWDREGRLHFLGRADRQVKINGIRIEPGEIEAALCDEPGVRAAWVVVRGEGASGRSLVAYVLGADAAPDTASLRTRLAARLPRHLVPAAVVPVTEPPLGPTGKVDRKALPAPERAPATEAATPRAEVLAANFAASLGLPSAGADDDFFALGGNSLSAVRLTGRVRDALGLPVSVRDLFEAPTPAALDRRLSEGTAPEPADDAPAPPRPARLPLSPAQLRLWTANYLGEHRPTYLTTLALDLSGPLHRTVWEQSLGDLVARHEILRTVLPYGPDGPEQRILSPAEAPPDLRFLELAPGEERAAVEAELARGFDLLTGTPLRARLLSTGPERHLLLLVVHHVAVDGHSLGVLRGDLRHAYAARLEGEAPRWQTPAPQYADHALRVARRRGDEGDPASPAARDARHWAAELEGVPARLALPGEPPTGEDDGRAGHVPLTWEPQEHRLLEEAATRYACSPYMVVHAAFAAALSDLGAGEDVPVVVALSGRDDAATDGLVGCVTNPVVLRVRTHGAPTGEELTARVRRSLLAAHAHQDHPYERVLEHLDRERAERGRGLFTVACSYLRTEPPHPEDTDWPGGLRVTPRVLAPTHTDQDLLLQLRDHRTPEGAPAGLTGELIHSLAHCTPSTAQRLADTLRTKLRELAGGPEEANMPYPRPGPAPTCRTVGPLPADGGR
ncbi:non-ribosomal peptide synthetase [Streptomyces sampsonii]|uniref:non-ribosomal peptide synthetase n=1 Tax=Streptomyces sampsonii TaxID=42239 RepID=UPI000B2E5143|nr:non-ribosomal peptide synthetase [Streptomyces sampsonii]